MSENPPPINLLFSKIVLLKEVVFPLLTIDAASMVFSTKDIPGALYQILGLLNTFEINKPDINCPA